MQQYGQLTRLSTLWNLPYFHNYELSSDGRYLALDTGRAQDTTQVIDLYTGEIIQRVRGSVSEFEGDTLLTQFYLEDDETKPIWYKQRTDFRTGNILEVWRNIPASHSPGQLQTAPHARRFERQGQQIILYDETDRPLAHLAGTRGELNSDCSLLAVYDSDNLRMVRTQDGMILAEFQFEISSVDFIHHDRFLLCEDARHDLIYLIDLQDFSIRLKVAGYYWYLDETQNLLGIDENQNYRSDTELSPEDYHALMRTRLFELPSCRLLAIIEGKLGEEFSPDGQWLHLTDHVHYPLRYLFHLPSQTLHFVGQNVIFGRNFILTFSGGFIDIYGDSSAWLPSMPPARPNSGLGKISAPELIIYQYPRAEAELAIPQSDYFEFVKVIPRKGQICMVLGQWEDWFYITHLVDEYTFLDTRIFVTLGWIHKTSLETLETWGATPTLDPENPLHSLRSASSK